MNIDELNETVEALFRLCTLQSGQLAAQRTISDAIIATIGANFPPIAEQLIANIDGLSKYARGSLEYESEQVFDKVIGATKDNIRILLQR